MEDSEEKEAAVLRDEAGRFLTGSKGLGRPKGVKPKLAAKFVDDVYAIWNEQGPAILQDARAEKPMEFAKMVAGLLPREHLIRKAPEEEMSDDELADTIAALETIAAELGRGRKSISPTHSGQGTA